MSNGHLDNVIAEVERLRSQAERLHELHGEALTAIAALRDEVERLTGLLGQSMVGHTVKDITIATLREALERAHACATLKNDGTCLGCFISVALAATEEENG